MKIHVLFVCLGNICRSPMAEAVFKHLIEKEQLQQYISVDSAATSSWEHGNPVHPGTKKRLAQENIGVEGMFSRPLNSTDIKQSTYIIGMDESNMTNIKKFINHRPCGTLKKLLAFADSHKDIADPWYTGDFDQTYQDILTGCTALIHHIKEHDLKDIL